MKLQRKNRLRATALGALAVSGALVLTACGSDDNSGGSAGGGSGEKTSAASDVKCDDAKGQLLASGSSAQKNAMDLWVKNYMAGLHRRGDQLQGRRPPVRASSPSTRAPSASPAPTRR